MVVFCCTCAERFLVRGDKWDEHGDDMRDLGEEGEDDIGEFFDEDWEDVLCILVLEVLCGDGPLIVGCV